MKGQMALKDASVLVIGAGGLGSPCLLYLAAAGIGHIGIVDGDTVRAAQQNTVAVIADVLQFLLLLQLPTNQHFALIINESVFFQ